MRFHVQNTLNPNVHTVIYNDHPIFFAPGNHAQKTVLRKILKIPAPRPLNAKNLRLTEAQTVREFMIRVDSKSYNRAHRKSVLR